MGTGLDILTEVGVTPEQKKALDAFMKEYRGMTHDNFIDPRNRVWILPGDAYVFSEISPWYGNNAISLHAVMVNVGEQKKGHAGKVMKEIVKLADKHGVRLYGTAKPFGTKEVRGMTAAKLKAWYKRLGFKVKGQTVVREPKEKS